MLPLRRQRSGYDDHVEVEVKKDEYKHDKVPLVDVAKLMVNADPSKYSRILAQADIHERTMKYGEMPDVNAKGFLKYLKEINSGYNGVTWLGQVGKHGLVIKRPKIRHCPEYTGVDCTDPLSYEFIVQASLPTHENMLAAYGCFWSDGMPHLLTERIVPGIRLSDYIKGASEEDVCWAIVQILFALASVSKYGFTQNDLHADNILAKENRKGYVDYNLDGKVYRIDCKYTWVIIDYGRARTDRKYLKKSAQTNGMEDRLNWDTLDPSTFMWQLGTRGFGHYLEAYDPHMDIMYLMDSIAHHRPDIRLPTMILNQLGILYSQMRFKFVEIAVKDRRVVPYLRDQKTAAKTLAAMVQRGAIHDGYNSQQYLEFRVIGQAYGGANSVNLARRHGQTYPAPAVDMKKVVRYKSGWNPKRSFSTGRSRKELVELRADKWAYKDNKYRAVLFVHDGLVTIAFSSVKYLPPLVKKVIGKGLIVRCKKRYASFFMEQGAQFRSYIADWGVEMQT